MKNRENLISILKNLYIRQFDVCNQIYHTELVNNGKMTISVLQGILSRIDNLDKLSNDTLLLLYEPLSKQLKGTPPLSEFFTDNEIQKSKLSMRKNAEGKLPVKLKIFAKLTDNDNYLSCVSIQQINELKTHGLIRWEQHMQRESVITKLPDNTFISHIKFDDNRARAIGESMSEGTFYPNALRWHVTTDVCDYDVTDNEFILKDGWFAEIDGQHRDKGSEYALLEHPDMIMNMPVIITCGNVATAQHIINQDEERAPIDRNVVEGYRASSGNTILKFIIGNANLDSVYKFCDTLQGISAGSGFILKSVVSEAIDKHYCDKKLSRNVEIKIAEWIVTFLNELADIYFNEFSNYKKKSPITHYEMFKAYIYFSYVLQDKPEWQVTLQSYLNKIDFTQNVSKITAIKYLNSIIKEGD